MGVSFVSISALSSVLILLSLQWWIGFSIGKLRSDGLISDHPVDIKNAGRTLELLLSSDVTLALLAGFTFSVFVLVNLCLKSMFFGELYPTEIKKFLERLVNYIVYKGTFLPLIVPQTKVQGFLWLAWLIVLCSLKLFQALARDRLERINASPAAKPWTYFRVFSMLLVVLFVDMAWMGFCWGIYRSLGSYVFLLLFYEPFSILFETLQAIMVHGFQLLDIWFHHSTSNSTSKLLKLNFSSTGSFWEWKGILIRNLGFSLDMVTLLMALAHYVHIWWFRGMALHLVDVVLFLNIRALFSAIFKRMKGFIRLKKALSALHGALPDASSDELRAYDDECAICREAMAKAKKLSCNHLFHLSCLRSWLDQGSNEVYSCPTCRKPLFVGEREGIAHRATEAPGNRPNVGANAVDFNQQSTSRNTAIPRMLSNSTENPPDRASWSPGLDAGWVREAPPSSSIEAVGLGGVQMMVRQLASLGETYTQSTFDGSPWSLWPANGSPTPNPGRSVFSSAATRFAGNGSHSHRTASSTVEAMANILEMVEAVHEILPHIPEELILQDLQRTRSATVTVNNLLQL